jgi:hypothetical protein
VNGNSTLTVKVEGGGTQVVAHVGLHALGRFADRIGLGTALSGAVPWTGERAPHHDRGTVLTQAMLMLAGGGESCADIEHLRTQESLFGDVASDSTLYRTITAITATVLADLNTATAPVRTSMWRRMNTTVGTDRVVLDIDASLVEIHSENKTGTAATYKGGFGFAPMFCFADATGETLAGLLRPGNAAANTVADHLTVLDTAIGQLPAEVAAGHHQGDDKDTVRQLVQVRTDSAGCTRGFVDGCRERNVGFAVVARQIPKIHAAIGKVKGNDRRWKRATPGDRGQRCPVVCCRVHRSCRSVGLADRDTADHPPRETPPRRPTLVVPIDHLPLLGSLHRQRRWHTSRARRAHARSRACRGQHQTIEGVRTQPVPVRRSRREPSVDANGHDRRQSCAMVPTVVLHRPDRESRTETTPLDDVAHTGTNHPARPTTHRAHHRWLAHHQRPPRRLHPDQRAQLTRAETLTRSRANDTLTAHATTPARRNSQRPAPTNSDDQTDTIGWRRPLTPKQTPASPQPISPE